jgi:hypothetical protein
MAVKLRPFLINTSEFMQLQAQGKRRSNREIKKK